MKRANTDLMAIGLILASAVAGVGATLALTASRHDAAPRLSGHAIHEDFHDPDPAVVVRCRSATVVIPGKRIWKSMTLESLGKSSEGIALGCTNARFVFVRGPGARERSEVVNRGVGSWQFQFSVSPGQSLPVPDPALPTSPSADPG